MAAADEIGKIEDFEAWLHGLRSKIADAFAQREAARASERKWSSQLGEGCASVFEDGAFLERASIGVSRVAAASLPAAATAARPELAGQSYQACGLSLIAHPRNPHAPTVHMNVRHFRAAGGGAWWFGGGMDLTPWYGYDEDCRHFHKVCRDCLAPHGAQLYPDFKQRCDEYFRLPHRGEQRGIGGVFFDDFNAGGYEAALAVTQAVGDAFPDAYLPILDRRSIMPYGERERRHQLIRRGRYVEFNLMYDRGTLFGLQSGGNSDAILASMPPLASWSSSQPPAAGSAEERYPAEYLVPRAWA